MLQRNDVTGEKSDLREEDVDVCIIQAFVETDLSSNRCQGRENGKTGMPGFFGVESSDRRPALSRRSLSLN